MIASNHAELGREVALKLAVHMDDEPIVRSEHNPTRPRLSKSEVAIGPKLKPLVKLIAASQPAAADSALEIFSRYLGCICRDLVLCKHEIDYGERAVQGGIWISAGIAIVGLRQHPDEQCGFRERQVLHPHPEIVSGGVVEAVHVACVRHDIQVPAEDFRPRQALGDS